MSDFFSLINERESCRSYTGEHVEKELLLQCIEAARLAPSTCNGQPWYFYLVLNDHLKGEMVKLTQPFTSKAAGFIVMLEEKPSLPTKFANKFKEQDFTQIDLGIAASHICLAATQLGLSTCMIGWFREDKMKKLLGIPKNKRIRLVFSVGHAAKQEIRDKKRKELDKILTIID